MLETRNIIYLIEKIENKQTIELIGKIDISCLENMDGNDLLYIFPLIERMIIEIYKLVPGAIVENNEQGIMKTITQIIKDNENHDIHIIEEDIKTVIFKYYDNDDSLRNILFHSLEDTLILNYDQKEICSLIFKLLTLLKNQINQYDINSLKMIENI